MNYETIAYDAYLAHHGVKGMKWGVRRKQSRHSYALKRPVDWSRSDYKKAVRVKKKLDKSIDYGNRVLDRNDKKLVNFHRKLNKKLRKHNYENADKYISSKARKRLADLDREAFAYANKVKSAEDYRYWINQNIDIYKHKKAGK